MVKFVFLFFLFFSIGCTSGNDRKSVIYDIAKNRAYTLSLYSPIEKEWGVISEVYSDKNTINVVVEISNSYYREFIKKRDSIIKNICDKDEVIKILDYGIVYRFTIINVNDKSSFYLSECGS